VATGQRRNQGNGDQLKLFHLRAAPIAAAASPLPARYPLPNTAGMDAEFPSGIFSIAARRRAWYFVESIDDRAAAAHDGKSRMRRRRTERMVAM